MSRLHNWQLFTEAFPEDALAAVNERVADVHELKQARVFHTDENMSEEALERLKKIRSSKVVFLSEQVKVREVLYSFVCQANRSAFGVDITHVGDIQYTEYDAKENGHYDWHQDVNWFDEISFQRKLSIVVQLSDPIEYEGGDFLFKGLDPMPVEFKRKGSVLVFPSYLEHKVEPVTKGIRKSLVAWFEGPRWR
jgi:PKHD-type hydroxylase